MSQELFFRTPALFNQWLAENYHAEEELWLCYYKKHTGKQTITWEESVEEALCFGWIDGLRRSRDDESYMIRFTPRRKTSIWSPKNLTTIQKLIKENRIKEAGLAIYDQRKPGHAIAYENMNKDWKLDKAYLVKLKSDKIAQEYYESLSAGLKKQVQRWVMTAKKNETRDRRFNKLFESCQKQELIPQLQWGKKK